MEHKGEILNEIRTRTYTPHPVLRMEIPKFAGGVRRLGIPTIVDRTIQQAIQKGLDYMNEGFNWVVDIDLEKFFDTVSHDRVKEFGRT
ncbi:hypothetical protein [Lactococcus garvieae]|uniref:hypothetical protein n=1 Tax=Lactococcus garvieae TaxID=1363 RepID=UPI003852B4CE